MEKLKVKFSVDWYSLPEPIKETIRKNNTDRYNKIYYERRGIIVDRYRGCLDSEHEKIIFIDFYLILGEDDHTYHIVCDEVSIIK